MSQVEQWMKDASREIDAKVLRFDTREIEARPIEWLTEVIARHAPAAAPGQMPSCHACGTFMEGVCPECHATTAPVSEREAVLEEACNVIAYWADTHRGETTFGEATRVLIERIRAIKGKEQGNG